MDTAGVSPKRDIRRERGKFDRCKKYGVLCKPNVFIRSLVLCYSCKNYSSHIRKEYRGEKITACDIEKKQRQFWKP